MEAADETREERRHRKRKERSARIEFWSTKLSALLWIFAGIFVVYYTQFLQVLWGPQRFSVGLWYLRASQILLAASTACFARLVYREKMRLPQDDGFVLLTTLGFACSFLVLTFALWGVYGAATPVILAVLSMSLLMMAHFLPAM